MHKKFSYKKCATEKTTNEATFEILNLSGAPRMARPPRPGPCLDFGFQYSLIRNNLSKKFGGRILGLARLKFAMAPLASIYFVVNTL